MSPVIGVTSCYNPKTGYYHLAADYVLAVEAAGGEPIILAHTAVPVQERQWGMLNGLLLTGGGDVDPVHFGQEPLPENGVIDPLRDSFELSLTARALAVKMPVLGICRGMQVLNLAAGGTICQDIHTRIKSALKHVQTAPRWYPTHAINVSKGTLLDDILGCSNCRVNSFHHQMIDQIAPGFTMTAQAEDGVAEAIELDARGRFVIGVQFHPEGMWEKDLGMARIFRAFVKAAKCFRLNKPENNGGKNAGNCGR